MAKVICIGSASKDMFFPTKDGLILETPEDLTAQRKIAFELGAKYHIEARYEALGGCATNVASGLARLGHTVACNASIGDDVIGDWILREMRKQEIGRELINVKKQCRSDLSVILVEAGSGERTIFSNQVSNRYLTVQGVNLENCEWIFIGDLSGQWQKNIKEIIRVGKEHKIPLAINPRQKMIHDDVQAVISALQACDVVFVNKDEAIEIVSATIGRTDTTKLNDESFLVHTLAKQGPRIVSVTDGVRGAWVGNGKQIWHADACLRPAMDTTGAGDAFTSGFLGAYLDGMDVENALTWGIANSSSSVGYYGGQAGLLDNIQILADASSIEVRLISQVATSNN